MCANFKPITADQVERCSLPKIEFSYSDEVYPMGKLPLLFRSELEIEWREVIFGMVPKWAADEQIAKKTYNARQETLLQKPTFQQALQKYKFGVIPVTEFYESKYIDGKPQRWGVRRKDGEAFFIAALYEISKIDEKIIRSTTMLTMDAIDHPMMKDFHEPGNVKRSVIIIPHHQVNDWLSLKTTNIAPFVQGFPVDEFECLYVPKEISVKDTPQLSMFND
ncbi:SOS response-associated peptidase [Acinetobacter pollinis]|uniref:SOS response-associated peptidase n=1 Tax=Acinetobacter pollinis TaxID=2605270 RepID=UPI0018A2BE88|nr:SOS response-associated peptidase family protein [Acinetobacter pollinis]MBF7689513.1 SOS response-associated peptidase family protein [Acinetobacter pollinis]MBF7692159.1 SOS response-associated peptidase family protein [Acinetobacter pollinis]MBF7696892.1 SOS response-associated peptidase family protein [Acinetobacter pollinis]MBF7700284.1 SOS response-associated peptidase family protein [Acinetobacter pollinis]